MFFVFFDHVRSYAIWCKYLPLSIYQSTNPMVKFSYDKHDWNEINKWFIHIFSIFVYLHISINSIVLLFFSSSHSFFFFHNSSEEMHSPMDVSWYLISDYRFKRNGTTLSAEINNQINIQNKEREEEEKNSNNTILSNKRCLTSMFNYYPCITEFDVQF